jgi:hypothetical protein
MVDLEIISIKIRWFGFEKKMHRIKHTSLFIAGFKPTPI